MTFSTRTFRFPVGVIVLLACALLLSGCDEGSLNAPEVQSGGDNGDLFASYVALGNSITAGFQSGGIVDTTQEASYAVLLSEQMGTPFNIPTLVRPGCPPPFVELQQRPPGTNEETCGLRSQQTSGDVRNVALPFAAVADATSNETGNDRSATFSQFLLGGRTQVQAALETNPTFASIWIGNNDVLGPARDGLGTATPQSTFESEYTEMLDELETAETLQGGVLVGVANITVIPFFSPGPVYEALEGTPQFPPTLTVQNCTSTGPNGLTPLVPLSYGFKLIGQARKPGGSATLDCSADSKVLTLAEVQSLASAVQQYNTFIESQARQRDFAFFNPNDVLQTVYQDQNGTPNVPTDDPIPKFPATTADQPFGPFFSLDGIHPSDATHRLIANELVKLLNQPDDQGGYGTNLPTLNNVPSVPSP